MAQSLTGRSSTERSATQYRMYSHLDSRIRGTHPKGHKFVFGSSSRGRVGAITWWWCEACCSRRLRVRVHCAEGANQEQRSTYYYYRCCSCYHSHAFSPMSYVRFDVVCVIIITLGGCHGWWAAWMMIYATQDSCTHRTVVSIELWGRDAIITVGQYYYSIKGGLGVRLNHHRWN